MEASSLEVRFPRQPRRGVVLGFSGPRVSAGIAAALLIMGGLLSHNMNVLIVLEPTAAMLIGATFIRVKGRYAIDWLPLWAHWQVRGAAHQRRFRAQLMTLRPAGTLALPGNAARLRVLVNDDDVAYVHDPRAGTLTAALRVEHSAMVLLDPSAQAERVSGWSRALSSLAGNGSVSHVAVLEETIPDTGNGPLEWFNEHWTKKDDWASQQYYSLLDNSRFQSSTHRTTVTISVKVGRRGLDDARVNMAAQRKGIEDALSSAGLRVVGWLSEGELARQVRQAYAPFSPANVELLAAAGPVAIDEEWGWFRHDDGVSCVLALAEFPATPVGPQFLHSLIFSSGVRHTFALIARVQSIDAALRQVRRDKASSLADTYQKAKMGQVADMSDGAEYADIEAREAALIQGHAAVNLTALVTVMAPTLDELKSAVEQIKRDAGRCACEARVLHSMQAAAFVAAALPLGRAI
jgi:hypothetical protein